MRRESSANTRAAPELAEGSFGSVEPSVQMVTVVFCSGSKFAPQRLYLFDVLIGTCLPLKGRMWVCCDSFETVSSSLLIEFVFFVIVILCFSMSFMCWVHGSWSSIFFFLSGCLAFWNLSWQYFWVTDVLVRVSINWIVLSRMYSCSNMSVQVMVRVADWCSPCRGMSALFVIAFLIHWSQSLSVESGMSA